MLVNLQSDENPQVRQVGGKAASLIRLAQAGFSVPTGSVLTTDFFAPWVEQVEHHPRWHDVLSSLNNIRTPQPNAKDRDSLTQACDELKQTTTDFVFTQAPVSYTHLTLPTNREV